MQFLYVFEVLYRVSFLSVAECFFVEPDEAVDTGTLEENKLNLTLDFHR